MATIRIEALIEAPSNPVLEEGEGRCRFVWIADLLPDAAAETVGPMMRQGTEVLKATMEAAAR